MQFQFHKGSIKSDAGNAHLNRVWDFNSTKVRLKDVIRIRLTKIIEISIPQRFD